MNDMKKLKLRTVVTTDGEIDDMDSFIRFLLYSNDVDVAGIILTSSMFHYRGTAEKPAYRWTGETWIPELIAKYGHVYPNLMKHDPTFPTPESLLSVYRIGNVDDVSDMTEETEGSNFLADLILDDDDRPLYIQTWGGTNTTARALKSIQERYEGTADWDTIKKKVEDKVVLYIILDQDGTYGDYISKNWNIKTLNDSLNFGYFAYGWKGLPEAFRASLNADWHLTHLKNKGPLLDQYALIGDGYYLEGEVESEQFGQQAWLNQHPDYEAYDFISEGDSPSYFYLLQTSLRGFENPSFGGWGGRFREISPNTFTTNQTIDYNPYTKRFEQEYSLYRWIPDIQADLAARAQWCITDDFKSATHYPQVKVAKKDIQAEPGQIITLQAEASDLNGYRLNYHWWCYHEASSYWDFSNLELESDVFRLGDMDHVSSWHSKEMEIDWALPLTGEDTPVVQFTVPEDAKPDQTLHMILEVSNIADLPLKTYERVIVTVK